RAPVAVPEARARAGAAEAAAVAADQHIARVGTWGHGAEREPGCEGRGDVLQGVHGAIDPSVGERLLELLHEEALATGRRQRSLRQAVPARADQYQLDRERRVEALE